MSTAPLRAPRHALTPAVRLLIATGTSSYGDWLTTVALVVLLFRATHSPLGPAIYMIARVAPRLIGPFPGGALADRYGPAPIAAGCAVVQGLLTASIVVFAESRIIWPIFVVVAFAQFFSSAAQPCYGALIPRVTDATGLGRIQGASSAIASSSLMVSPAIGALLLPFTAPEVLVAIDAATFFFAAAMVVTLLRVGDATSGPPRGTRGMSAGIPIVLRDPMLRFLAAAYVSNGAAVTSLQAVLVVAAAQRFGHDSAVGWLYAAIGAGSLLGTLPVIRRTPKRVSQMPIIGFTILELAPLAAFVFVTPVPFAVGLLFLSAIGATLYQTRGAVGLQQRVPRELLGRTMAVERFAGYLGMLLGAIAAVCLVQPLGWESTVLIVCAAGATLLFVTAVSEGGEPG
ncbi:MAG: MFS transporter [Candidatus Dormibacteria bacterium]